MKSKKNRTRNKKTKKYYGGGGTIIQITQSSDYAAKDYINNLTEYLNNNFQNLNNLEFANIASDTGLTKIPDLTRFMNLKSVIIKKHTGNIKNTLENFDINNLPTSIRDLIIGDTNIEDMPDLTRFTNLERLDIWNNEKIKSIGRLPSSIKKIYVYNCKNLFHFKFGKFPEGLIELTIYSCPSLEIIPKIPFVEDNPIHRVRIINSGYAGSIKLDKHENIPEYKKQIEDINDVYDKKVKEKPEAIEREFAPENVFAKLGDQFRTMDVAEYLRKKAAEHAEANLKPTLSARRIAALKKARRMAALKNTRKRKNREDGEHHITLNEKRDARFKLDQSKTKKSRLDSPNSLPARFGVNEIDIENPNELDENMEKIIENFEKENPGKIYPKEIFERFDETI